MIKFCAIHEVPLNLVTEECCLCNELKEAEQQSVRFDDRREQYHEAQQESEE
jgi:hypothetical protein